MTFSFIFSFGRNISFTQDADEVACLSQCFGCLLFEVHCYKIVPVWFVVFFFFFNVFSFYQENC